VGVEPGHVAPNEAAVAAGPDLVAIGSELDVPHVRGHLAEDEPACSTAVPQFLASRVAVSNSDLAEPLVPGNSGVDWWVTAARGRGQCPEVESRGG
jgi:hypothetical protein